MENELHHFEQVVLKNVRVTLADCRELDVVDRFRLSSLELRQCGDLYLLHLLGDALESLLILRMRHDPQDRRDKVARAFKDTIDSVDRLAVVTLGALGIEQDFLGLLKVAETGRHRHVHIVVVAGDHQGDIIRVEGRHLQDHRVLAQVDQRGDVERVVVGPRDLSHRVIFKLGIGVRRVPATLFDRELIVHVVHGDVLVGAFDEVLDLRV